MQLLYMGFEQAENVREYIFHRVVRGEATRVFVISTDMTLFREPRLSLQEGPILCLHTLAAALEASGPDGLAPRHAISEQDVHAYLVSRPAPGSKKVKGKRPPGMAQP
jgi:hypothetical protein